MSPVAGSADRGARRLLLAGIAAVLLAALLVLDGRLMALITPFRGPGVEPIALAITSLGWGASALAIAVALAAGGWAGGNPRVTALGLHGLGAVSASGLLGQAAKLLFGRVRPGGGDLAGTFQFLSLQPGNSFPSGHATTAFAFAAVLAHAYPRWRWAGYVGAFLVALSRLYLNKHFPADALAGALLGATVGHLAGGWLDRRLEDMQARRTPEAR